MSKALDHEQLPKTTLKNSGIFPPGVDLSPKLRFRNSLLLAAVLFVLATMLSSPALAPTEMFGLPGVIVWIFANLALLFLLSVFGYLFVFQPWSKQQ